MPQQLVAPTVQQWRELQRIARRGENAYTPGPEYFAEQLKNRQLLQLTSDAADGDTGFYPAKWILSDVVALEHEQKADVWAWVVAGDIAEGAWVEAAHVGTHTDGVPVFRGVCVPDDDLPDIARIVTNVCPTLKIGKPIKIQFPQAVEVDGGGQDLLRGTINLTKGVVTIRVSVNWTDPDWEAYTADEFTFILGLDSAILGTSEKYSIIFGGPSAETTRELTVSYTVPSTKQYQYSVIGIRNTGSGKLTATTASFLEITPKTGSIVTEYRQAIVPKGMRFGKKVCVTDPQDCCLDDQSSNTSSDYLNLACCPVPVPSQWRVAASGISLKKSGMTPWVYGQRFNFDTLADGLTAILNGTFTLTFKNVQPYPWSSSPDTCVYQYLIPYESGLHYFRQLSGADPVEQVDIGEASWNSQQPKIVFYLRHLPRTNQMFSNWSLPPYGPRDTPEVQAYATLFFQLGAWGGEGGVNPNYLYTPAAQYTPHYTREFHRDYEGLATAVWDHYDALAGGGWHTVGTACDGDCNLMTRPPESYEFPPNMGQLLFDDSFPLFLTVEPVR